jgi:hypothetical protein
MPVGAGEGRVQPQCQGWSDRQWAAAALSSVRTATYPKPVVPHSYCKMRLMRLPPLPLPASASEPASSARAKWHWGSAVV